MDWTILSLLLIGAITAVAPCPLATNIAALSFITRSIQSKRDSCILALLYTLGRTSAYVLIGALISEGIALAPALSYWLQEELPLYLGPIFMLTGLILLDYLPFFSLNSKPTSQKAAMLLKKTGWIGAFILGFLFALALCPPSAALFFGTALPLSLQGGSTLAWLGISFFGLGTAIPIVSFAFLLLFSAHHASAILNKLPKIQEVIKSFTAWFFFLLGAYWLITKILLV